MPARYDGFGNEIHRNFIKPANKFNQTVKFVVDFVVNSWYNN